MWVRNANSFQQYSQDLFIQTVSFVAPVSSSIGFSGNYEAMVMNVYLQLAANYPEKNCDMQQLLFYFFILG